MQGTVVIGEGEMDEAPMLYIGEQLGTGNGPGVDVAVDHMGGFNVVVAMVKSLMDAYGTTVPVAIHLDHGSKVE